MQLYKDLRFYISEILQNEKGEYSSANLWLHLGNIAITFAYVYIVWYAAKLNPIPLEGLSFLTLIMGGLITGNKLAHKFMNMKYGSVSLEGPKDGVRATTQ